MLSVLLTRFVIFFTVSSYLVFTRNVIRASDESNLSCIVRQARVAWAATFDGAFPVAPGVWQPRASAATSSSGIATEESLPSSEDEAALAFLCQFNYDIPRTSLVLVSMLGSGEHSAAKIPGVCLYLATMCSIPANFYIGTEHAAITRLSELHEQLQTSVSGPGAGALARTTSNLSEEDGAAAISSSSSTTAAAPTHAASANLLSAPRQRARRVVSNTAGEDAATARVESALGLAIGFNSQFGDASSLLGLNSRPTLPTLQELDTEDAGSGVILQSPVAPVAPGPPSAAIVENTAAGASSDAIMLEDIDGLGDAGLPGPAVLGKDGKQQPLTEQQKQRRWRAWAADARLIAMPTSTASIRCVPWDNLVALRTAAEAIPPLSPFAGGGNNAALANEVSQVRCRIDRS